MDPEIQQLKEEIKRLSEVNKDTNRIVHGMRRSQRWHTFVSVVWWLVILGIASASWWYALPYIQKAQEAYSGFQNQAQKAQGWEQKIQDLYNQYIGTSSKAN